MNVTLRNLEKSYPNRGLLPDLLALLGKTEADDTEVSIEYILKNVGIVEAVTALSAVEGDGVAAKSYMFELVNQLKPLMSDARSLKALELAEKYKDAKLTKAQLNELNAADVDAQSAYVDIFEASNEEFTEAFKAAYLAHHAAAVIYTNALFYYDTQPERILAGHPVSSKLTNE